VQNLQYAGRAIELAEALFGEPLEPAFLERLEKAPSNVPEHRNGAHIYKTFVPPAMATWEKIAAHYAVRARFEEDPEPARVYCYTFDRQDAQRFEAGKATLLIGRALVTSELTREAASVSFGLLHLGDQNIHAGGQVLQGEERYRTLLQELTAAFTQADFPGVVRLMDRYFAASTYPLKSLFRDEQWRVLHLVLEASVAEAETVYRQIYEQHVPLMRLLTDLGLPFPKAFGLAAGFFFNSSLRRALQDGEIDRDRITALLEEAAREHIALDTAELGGAFQRSLQRTVRRLSAAPTDLVLLKKLQAAVALLHTLPFDVDLWHVQNTYYELLKAVYPEFLDKADQGDAAAQAWVECFVPLGEALGFRPPC
jgi:hypothetical protein